MAYSLNFPSVSLDSTRIQYDQNMSGGTMVGQTSTSLVGFFGATPVVPQTVIDASDSTTATRIITALKTYGLLV